MQCERCQKNPARVRVDQLVNGQRESHYFCQSCVDQHMDIINKELIPKQERLSATILQILPAQPGAVAVWASLEHADNLTQGQKLYTTEALVCWALVEYLDRYPNGSERTKRAVVGMTRGDDAPEIELLSENDRFLGYSFPGDENDWDANARHRRKALGIN